MSRKLFRTLLLPGTSLESLKKVWLSIDVWSWMVYLDTCLPAEDMIKGRVDKMAENR